MRISVWFILFCSVIARADDAAPAGIRILSPQAWQVVQRERFDVRQVGANEPHGRKLGHALVHLRLEVSADVTGPVEVQTTLLPGCQGDAINWMEVAGRRDGDDWNGELTVPAGGWYRLEVRGKRQGETVTAAVERFGIGEVFLVAGQSYAGGANDELMPVCDPQQRVSRWHPQTGAWDVAHDPQPTRGEGGTIWPPLGDHLAGLLGVPVAFANVSVGATSSRQWLPGEPHFEQLALAGEQLGAFRAVLWQQGESDVIEKTSTEIYVQNLTAIRDGLAARWGKAPAWLMAKSTLHPTVYKRPEDEAAIRAAVDLLVAEHGFQAGPDTDMLGGENRGGDGTRRHFSGVGQRRAALLWLIAIWNELERQREGGPSREASRSQ